MVHVDNLPHILVNGITKKDSAMANPDFKSIGDVSLIGNRSTKIVEVYNGDYTMLNPTRICLGDFIPFYFGIRMPMLYVMQNGGNFVETATAPQDIVYIVCSLRKVLDSGTNYYFSDGHGTDGYTTFYDNERILDLPGLIDWDCVQAKFWGGDENLNTKRKKQAEFLVASDLPSSCILGFLCYNETAKKRLMQIGINEAGIKVWPNAYY
ncbi:hypothetical protein SRABI36_04969 [Pedobacter sp. Bi36]|nr:hypothetical protein SRABI36_04969 [Pedobacter sp. Bi36]